MSFNNLSMLKVGKISFDLSDFIGKGRYGHVFHGKYKDVLPVAIKRLDRRLVSVNETTLLKAVGHQNVTQCFYVNIKDIEYIFLGIELCTCTLAQYILEPINPQPLNSVDILKQMCLGLSHLHGLEIVHSGLSPSNVLLSMSTFAMAPMVKLTDFGLVPSGHQRQLYSPPDEDEDQQLIVALMHSEGWTAPDGQLTSASDIFITGCLFSFVLGKGFHPFGSNALSRVKRIVRKRSMVLTLQQLENLPNAADALMLIQSMVNFNPAERPSIQQVLNSGFLAIPLASPTVHVPAEPLEKRVKLEAPSEDDDIEIVSVIQSAVPEAAQPGPSGTRNVSTAVDDVPKSSPLTSAVSQKRCSQHQASTSSAPLDPENKMEALIDLCSKKDLNRNERIRLRELAVDKDVDINRGLPLLQLCRYNHSLSLYRCMRSLLQRKEIDLNARTQSGFTALTLLTRYCQLPNLLDCVRLLIERDANVDITGRMHKNALHYLCEFYELDNLMDIAKLIVSKMVRLRSAGVAVETLKKRGYHKESKILAEVIESRIKELESAQ